CAAWKKIPSVASANPPAKIHQTDSTPAAEASGTEATTAALRRSTTIISRFRSRRSAQAPMSRPKKRCGKPNIANAIPSETAEPVSLKTSSGNANCVIELPKLEIVSPVQNFQKSPRMRAQGTGIGTHTSVVPDMLDRYLEQHGDRFVSELRELCAIPSEATDPGALDAAARWCRERLASAGAESH